MPETQNELERYERERLGTRMRESAMFFTEPVQSLAHISEVPMETITQEDRDKTYTRIEKVNVTGVDLRSEEFRHGARDHSTALGRYIGGDGTATDNTLIQLKEELSKAYQMVSETDISLEALSALTAGQVGNYIHDGLTALQEGRNPLDQFSVDEIDPNERGAAYLLGRIVAEALSKKVPN